jgi:glycosyltransferase involved in cell wall biosynthesis
MTQKKISIVTPSYNQGKFIEETILSVLQQGYGNIEHIIIDGGSTDNTLEVLKKYKHLQWMSEPDEGQSDALNKGFRLASGDIIGWLNADDMYTPGTFEDVAKHLSNNSVDAVYSNVLFVDGKGDSLRKMKVHKPVRWLSLIHCYIPSTTFFFKRRILDAGIMIDKEMHISMDKDFFANIFYSGYKVIYRNTYYAKFRWHESNKSIDTPEVKRMRYREGLTIYHRYASLKGLIRNINTYKYLSTACLFYRKLLKITSF